MNHLGIGVPAVCDTCGTVFASGIGIGPGAVGGVITGAKAGPCPNCQGIGSVLEGIYDFAGDSLKVVSFWPVERLQQLASAIEAARNEADPRAAVEEALTHEPELANLVRRLSPLTDSAAFWPSLVRSWLRSRFSSRTKAVQTSPSTSRPLSSG